MPSDPNANLPVRHHYVPRAYLASFTDTATTDRGRLWVYGRDPARAPAHEPLMAVAFEPHLYTVVDENGAPSPVLEQRLARDVEQPFTTWQRRVVKAPRGTSPTVLDRMTRRDRAAVALYILTQHLRTPAQRLMAARQAVVSHYLHSLEPQTRAAYRELWEMVGLHQRPYCTAADREVDFEEFFLTMRTHIQGRMDADTTLWLRPLGRFAEALVPTLVDRVWRIVELPREVERESPLITCDNPVVLTRPRPEGQAGRPTGWDLVLGGGWNEPAVVASLALSPRHALLIARDSAALTVADEPVRFAASMRVRTARHALHYVYARHDDARLAVLVRATRGPDVVFNVDGERFPGTVSPETLVRRARGVDAANIGIRFTDE